MELFELKFQGDFGAASDVVLKALKEKPDNKQLEVMSKYLSTSYLYVNSLQMQLQEAKLRINKLRDMRDKALDDKQDYKELYEDLQSKTLI
jgi:hypothetical protein